MNEFQATNKYQKSKYNIFVQQKLVHTNLIHVYPFGSKSTVERKKLLLNVEYV